MRISGRPLHVGGLQDESGAGEEGDERWVRSVHEEGLPLMLQALCLNIDNLFKLSEFNLYDDYHVVENGRVALVDVYTQVV